MHPALSIIIFTTLTGLGYGLATMLGIGILDPAEPAGRVGYVIAVGLIGVGLLFSTGHLGHPERAWRAFSQWRSSWLSREGVLAVITFIPLGLAAYGSVILGEAWWIPAAIAAVLSVVTVYSTSMIYASLRTIHQWHSQLTSAVYVALSLAGGLLAATALGSAFGEVPIAVTLLALAAFVVAAAIKVAWWRRADTETGGSTIESATGLGFLGKVRSLEPPHTEANYLTREMGFRVARKHASKLRVIAMIFGVLAPMAALAVLLAAGGGALTVALLVAALLAHYAGVFVERWLFFAEARHTVMLYYGDRTA